MSDPPAGPTLPFNQLVFFEDLHRVKFKHLIPSSIKTMGKWWKPCRSNFQFSMWLHLCFYSTEILVEITGVDRSCTLQRSSTRIWVAKRFMNFKNRLAGKLTWNLKITKSGLWKHKSSSKHPFLGLMLVFGSLYKGRIWVQQNKNCTGWFWVPWSKFNSIQPLSKCQIWVWKIRSIILRWSDIFFSNIF